MSLKRKKRNIFYQIIGLSSIFFFLFSILTINLFSKLILIGKLLLGKLEIICGCSNFIFSIHPLILLSLIFLGLIVIFFFCFCITKIVISKRSTGKFIKICLKKKKNNSLKLEKIVYSLKLENKVIEIKDKSLIIFCFGFLKPKICLSSTLVNQLSENELRAALLHEKEHLLSYEPLKIFWVKIIEKIFFFIPGFKILSRKYLIFSELTADQRATSNFKDKTALIGAMYKIIKAKEEIKYNPHLAFFSNVINERINKLTDSKYFPKIEGGKWIILNFFFILFLFFSFNIFSRKLVYPIEPAQGHNSSCFLEKHNPQYKSCEEKQQTHVCEKGYGKESACVKTILYKK